VTKPNPVPPVPIATIVLPIEALRPLLIEALTHPSVIDAIVDALRSRGAPAAALPKFMNPKEYAEHAKISLRTLHYHRSDMTEGVHFSRTGRRIRFHVAEADAFMSAAKGEAAKVAAEHASLEELARAEAAHRALDGSTRKGKRHATK
jgi:hypothetical protein